MHIADARLEASVKDMRRMSLGCTNQILVSKLLRRVSDAYVRIHKPNTCHMCVGFNFDDHATQILILFVCLGYLHRTFSIQSLMQIGNLRQFFKGAMQITTQIDNSVLESSRYILSKLIFSFLPESAINYSLSEVLNCCFMITW